jgi:Mn-dependent DtxR family transcriptional regulator
MAPDPRIKVALFSGYLNMKSTGFATAVSSLKSDCYVEYPDQNSVGLTESGTAKAGEVSGRTTRNAEVHERIKQLLKPSTAKMVDVLSDGRSHSRSALADALGYTCEKSTGFSKAL